jgi:Zn-dependent protease with chaperone function
VTTPIAGRLYSGSSTAALAATLELGADAVVRLRWAAGERSAPLTEVEISDRIGDIPRRVRFADGALFETADNAALDAALTPLRALGWLHRVGALERHWRTAAAALLAALALALGFARYGAPALAALGARVLPTWIEDTLGAQSLALLDRTLLEPSQLPEPRRRRLAEAFAELAQPEPGQSRVRLEFRAAAALGANAFALPAGILVITDPLIELAERDEEILAVLAHELGHARGRHSLRLIMQNAGLSALALALFGDLGSVSSLLAALPMARHSRELEREADGFARGWLQRHAIDPRHFDAILCRLARGAGDSALAFLDSHPPTAERADCGPAKPAASRQSAGASGPPALRSARTYRYFSGRFPRTSAS